MRLLADMNIAPLTVAALRVSGLDCVRVSDFLAHDATDEAILAFARDHDRVVLTQDNDFAALLAIGGHGSPSVITVRLGAPSPNAVSRRLIEVLPLIRDDLQNGAAAVVTEKSVRVRPLPIPRHGPH